MDEFDTIARLLRPLATSPEALGLADDAAVLPPRPGYELVVTTDTLVEGVHFLPTDPPSRVAQKLLRVNLSDLAAKGAEPYGYLLNIAWAPGWDEPRRADFAAGLAADQRRFRLNLFGGDTVSTPGPLTVGATLFGWVETGRMVKRSGARAGDLLLVSGTIGDGGLGLRAARGDLDGWDEPTAQVLIDRYQRPDPRVNLAPILRRFASASADVSDGLLADAAHIGEASRLRVELDVGQVPISKAAHSISAARPRVSGDEQRKVEMLLDLATTGDDYEIVCTAASSDAPALIAAAEEAGTPMTLIGRVVEGEGVRVTFHGEDVTPERLGWRHG